MKAIYYQVYTHIYTVHLFKKSKVKKKPKYLATIWAILRKVNFLNKNCCGLFLGNSWDKIGLLFLIHRLVTLSRWQRLRWFERFFVTKGQADISANTDTSNWASKVRHKETIAYSEILVYTERSYHTYTYRL